jgi:hypothetical protein
MDYRLSHKPIQKLRVKYRKIEGQRFANRIRIVLALAEGFTPTQLFKMLSYISEIFVFRFSPRKGCNFHNRRSSTCGLVQLKNLCLKDRILRIEGVILIV